MTDTDCGTFKIGAGGFIELTWSLKRTLPLTSSSSSCPKIAAVETTSTII